MEFRNTIYSLIGGVRGKVLQTMILSESEMSGRQIARLTNVSTAQCARMLADLVELGIVERRDFPPSAVFCIASGNFLSDSLEIMVRGQMLVERKMTELLHEFEPLPKSVWIFGSFARGDAAQHSDIDVLFVNGNDPQDERSSIALERWRANPNDFWSEL